MAQVTVRINGYNYTVGCDDGQEEHLRAMAEEVDRRIGRIKAAGGPSGEARLLVHAALLLADEVHDMKLDLARGHLAERVPTPKQRELARSLDRLASRAEEIAAILEHS